ncbi:MAG: hypothetical protein J6V11_01205, partial [Alphaproteobacteria bacterium]|nr:hypothetical protein [Alphaproteobacteria bacterium]
RPTPPNGPKGPQGPTNGPDRPTPPNGPKGPQGPTNGPDRPTPPNGPGRGPAVPRTNIGLDTLRQGQKRRAQGQHATGSLKNIRPMDMTGLYDQVRAVGQNMSSSLNAIQRNRANGAAINRARSGAPAYDQQRTGYEYAPQNMSRDVA